jgi:hypothetical protein
MSQIFAPAPQPQAVADKAEVAALTKRLGEMTKLLDRYSRLLGEIRPSHAALPTDFSDLKLWSQRIDQHLGDARNRQSLLDVAIASDFPRTAVRSSWCRFSTFPPQANPILLARGSMLYASKFNAGPLMPEEELYQTVYFSQDITTAALELTTAGAALDVLLLKNMYWCRFELHLENIADLTDPTTLRDRFGISPSQLVDPQSLRRGSVSVSQEIGAALFRAGFEGARVPSTRLGSSNLVLFPQNLSGSGLGSFVTGFEAGPLVFSQSEAGRHTRRATRSGGSIPQPATSASLSPRGIRIAVDPNRRTCSAHPQLPVTLGLP